MGSEKMPREFWIYRSTDLNIDDVVLMHKQEGPNFHHFTHVIEYSAYQELKERYEILLADVESYGLNRGS